MLAGIITPIAHCSWLAVCRAEAEKMTLLPRWVAVARIGVARPCGPPQPCPPILVVMRALGYYLCMFQSGNALHTHRRCRSRCRRKKHSSTSLRIICPPFSRAQRQFQFQSPMIKPAARYWTRRFSLTPHAKRRSCSRRLGIELAEDRLLLTGGVSLNSSSNVTVLAGAPLQVPINAVDAARDPLTYSVSSSNPAVSVLLPVD